MLRFIPSSLLFVLPISLHRTNTHPGLWWKLSLLITFTCATALYDGVGLSQKKWCFEMKNQLPQNARALHDSCLSIAWHSHIRIPLRSLENWFHLCCWSSTWLYSRSTDGACRTEKPEGACVHTCCMILHKHTQWAFSLSLLRAQTTSTSSTSTHWLRYIIQFKFISSNLSSSELLARRQ